MEHQILNLEKEYWKGMETHDFQIVKNLTYFPCITAGKGGVKSVDEASFKKMFESGNAVVWKVLDITAVQMHLFDSSAVIAYHIELESTMDGKTTAMQCACSSTWIKDGDKWLCAMHTESDLKK